MYAAIFAYYKQKCVFFFHKNNESFLSALGFLLKIPVLINFNPYYSVSNLLVLPVIKYFKKKLWALHTCLCLKCLKTLGNNLYSFITMCLGML